MYSVMVSQHFLFNEEIWAILDAHTVDIMLDSGQQTNNQNKHKAIDGHSVQPSLQMQCLLKSTMTFPQKKKQ